MTPRMVAGFRRSLSFPNNLTHSNKPKKTLHVRSTSLPSTRSHPLICQLKDELNELKTWASKPESHTSAWLCNGLTQLKIVHESLDDLLHLPQTRESLHDQTELVEKLLDDSLRFVDVYGIFQTLVLTLKEEHLAAQVAVRRKDESKIVSYIKSLRKLAKEMDKLVSNLQYCTGKYHVLPQQSEDAELFDVLKDVIEVTVLVSVTLFNGLSVSMSLPKASWLAKKVKVDQGIEECLQMGNFESLLRNKLVCEDVNMVSRRMHGLEGCICGIEIGGEKMFRSLINSRVSLLNIYTQ